MSESSLAHSGTQPSPAGVICRLNDMLFKPYPQEILSWDSQTGQHVSQIREQIEFRLAGLPLAATIYRTNVYGYLWRGEYRLERLSVGPYAQHAYHIDAVATPRATLREKRPRAVLFGEAWPGYWLIVAGWNHPAPPAFSGPLVLWNTPELFEQWETFAENWDTYATTHDPRVLCDFRDDAVRARRARAKEVCDDDRTNQADHRR